MRIETERLIIRYFIVTIGGKAMRLKALLHLFHMRTPDWEQGVSYPCVILRIRRHGSFWNVWDYEERGLF